MSSFSFIRNLQAQGVLLSSRDSGDPGCGNPPDELHLVPLPLWSRASSSTDGLWLRLTESQLRAAFSSPIRQVEVVLGDQWLYYGAGPSAGSWCSAWGPPWLTAGRRADDLS